MAKHVVIIMMKLLNGVKHDATARVELAQGSARYEVNELTVLYPFCIHLYKYALSCYTGIMNSMVGGA